jgi:Flp pilus assembly protein TadG
MVEFALLAPMFLLLVIGLLITGVVVLNDVELSNGVRDGARAGAICGSQLFNTNTSAQLPNATACNKQNLVTYVQSRISTIPGITPQISVDFCGGTGSSSLTCGSNGTNATTCSPGQKIQVSASYQQPLFAPLIGNFFGDSGNPGVRTITAVAEATCEQ